MESPLNGWTVQYESVDRVDGMCGRFTLTLNSEDIAALFGGLQLSAGLVTPRYNIAPTQDVLTIRQGSDGLKGSMLRWGLVPFWAKDLKIGSKMINARSETAATKPAFRAAFKKRRCLILADGFYEWKTVGSAKQPYYIQVNETAFCMAGLWESWKDRSREDTVVETCTILTTNANEALTDLHDRMPVILDEEKHQMWLDPEFQEPEKLQELMVPYPSEPFSMYPVSRSVNKPVNAGPECIKPIEQNRELF